jgi:ribulose bisphosphate carboxylase small subunit
MDIQAEKLLLIERLLQICDTKVIEQIRQLLEKSYNPIVGYESNGQPITQQDFFKQIEQAEKEYESGNYQPIDEVEKESETW